ncbi:MAG: enoyl-CoA hydratase [Sciscionella sp.]
MPEITRTDHAIGTLDQHGVATLTILNAKPLNILDTSVMEQVTAAAVELSSHAEVRVLVLRGEGDRAFIGGADIHEMSALNRTTAEAFIGRLMTMCETFRHFPTPVIARIPGWCLGGGLEVAAACDLRISSSDARFGMPEVAVGIPSVIHAALLPRLIGAGRATSMMLTGEQIDASTALSWGLLTTVCEPSELNGAVARAAQRFCELGPAVIREQKRLLRGWEQVSLDQAITDSVRAFGAAFDTGEPQRFMSQFLNRKRSG